ncbi:phosphohydrolase [Gordonia phage Bachita]|uniref:Uncharacterized protein n=3 Tax=Smoothievirus TaxID=1982557 RepID=A0A160DFQ8_9CAUD|nr:phosphohydrolase [Gordonia phage ClubL]YP_009276221.1 phosphohydrolase [Gordonia phage Bachita]ANA86607.1 hypothetical protein PBI_CLUBL_109 [Gordonia phage ClubL]ANA86785.1 hypothetical protein PBI_BACHITA_110 [Gordonia phage Bachita]QYC53594.1 membrane protein [Gordonia phage Norvs]
MMTDLKVQHLLDGIDDAKDEVRVKRRFMRILISLALLSWASVVIGFFISHVGISVTMVIVGFIAGLLFSGFSSFAWADYRDSLPKIRQAERAHRDHLIREGHL